jgi:hypothetical protein
MLDGASAYAAPRWWGRDKDEWIATLVAGGLVPPLDLLVAAEPHISPHLYVPLRGVLLRHLLRTLGATSARAVARREDARPRRRIAPRVRATPGRDPGNATRSCCAATAPGRV